MAVGAKICGLSTPDTVAAAVAGGAAFVGFVFYARSPRAVTPDEAASLGRLVPPSVGKVGLFVDEGDDRLAQVLAACPLDLLQLHGSETPARIAEIRARSGVQVMKAISVAGAVDIASAAPYAEAADWLMFDAKPPGDMAGALPGGNALSFDWRLLAGRQWARPWMLAGGLHAGNLAEAAGISGARYVDVSSGVEDAPGRKSPAKIAAFLAAARAL
ncbi:MAG: N-(5'-phosphoribosyl)anthranilate isomerase [Alphaproteobacteria bacterium]|nr:MAG: N-(5'-phosphoribosyl)anthranilate isomerase [Alphaproteobacteria bacterium]